MVWIGLTLIALLPHLNSVDCHHHHYFHRHIHIHMIVMITLFTNLNNVQTFVITILITVFSRDGPRMRLQVRVSHLNQRLISN